MLFNNTSFVASSKPHSARIEGSLMGIKEQINISFLIFQVPAVAESDRHKNQWYS